MEYPAPVARLLQQAGADLGDEVEVRGGDGRAWRGIVMEHHAFSAPDVLTLKLKSGYNVGVRVGEGATLALVRRVPPRRRVPREQAAAPGKPRVHVLATGGTIASYVDYRTGAVHPVTSPEELASAVPEIVQLADVRTKIVFSMFSEDLQPEHWQRLAREVKDAFDAGARGVVVTHGTDTMQYTAAALAFFLQDLPGPVVLVGAQRSSDRPSSDASLNLHAAVWVAAHAPIGEVVVVMHGSPSDRRVLIHRGTRVRKMHTSRRDAFQSINALPLGYIDYSPPTARLSLSQPVIGPSAGPVRLMTTLNERVAMIQSYPGLWPEHIENVVLDGVVLIGTGLGHVAERTHSALRRLKEEGKFVFMTSQCLYGRTNLNVYSSGRDLIRLGVVPCEDMLPEVAYVKAMWVLGQTQDREQVEQLFLTPVAGEIAARSDPTTFPTQEVSHDDDLTSLLAARPFYHRRDVPPTPKEKQFIQAKLQNLPPEARGGQEILLHRAIELGANVAAHQPQFASTYLQKATALVRAADFLDRPRILEALRDDYRTALFSLGGSRPEAKLLTEALHVALPLFAHQVAGPLAHDLRILGYLHALEAGWAIRWDRWERNTPTYERAIDLLALAAPNDPLSILVRNLEPEQGNIRLSGMISAIRENEYAIARSSAGDVRIGFMTRYGVQDFPAREIVKTLLMADDLAKVVDIAAYFASSRLVSAE